MNVRVLNDEAADLAKLSLADLRLALSASKTAEQLAMLRIAYIIVRRRNDPERTRLLASRIRRLDAALHAEDGPKAKRPYIVVRCQTCRNQVGQGKGKLAAIYNAKENGAHIVPVRSKDGQRRRTVICHRCFSKNPTVELYGLEGSHVSTRPS